MAKFDKSYKIVAKNEGGYQDNPKDSGNFYKGKLVGTNKGITPTALATYLSRDVTKTDMQNLSDETAQEIYKTKYWHDLYKIKSQSLADIIFDGNVNHGNSTMKTLLQKSLLKFDKSIDKSKLYQEEGIKEINKLEPKKLFDEIKTERKKFYKSLNKPEFINGWIRRINTFYYNGLPLTPMQMTVIGISTSILLVPVIVYGVHLYQKLKTK